MQDASTPTPADEHPARKLGTHIEQLLGDAGHSLGDVVPIVSTCRDHRCQQIVCDVFAGNRAPFMVGGFAGAPVAGETGVGAALLAMTAPGPVLAVSLTHATADVNSVPGCAALGMWNQNALGNAELPANAELGAVAKTLDDSDRVQAGADQLGHATALAEQTRALLLQWIDSADAPHAVEAVVAVAATLVHRADGDELVIHG